MAKVRHPAMYSDLFIPRFAELLQGFDNVLDPMAGVGKIALIKDHGFTGRVVCNEIEPEWAQFGLYTPDEWHIGDAADMSWAEDGMFDAICTSPTYGNRMADHYNAKDKSVATRRTYRHCLGRPLAEDNTGRMHWGAQYCKKHVEIYRECVRVLREGGMFIANVSDHMVKGVIQPVTLWHIQTLQALDVVLLAEVLFETRRFRYGANHAKRMTYEHVMVFIKDSNKQVVV